MLDLLALAYPWTKSLHIISVIAWMAGLFYLPRLFVYHAERGGHEGVLHETFTVMERRLLKAIMRPAMIATWLFGLALVMTPGVVDWGSLWPWLKAAGVILMTAFHEWCAVRYREFAAGQNTRSGRTYRMMNEAPTLLLIVIVLAVVVRF